MKTIKQGMNDSNCAAAVAAMICNTSIKHFIKVMGPGHREYISKNDLRPRGGGHCVEEVADYISMHHKQFGIGSGGFLRSELNFRKKQGIIIFNNILKSNAYVQVVSTRFKNTLHAVYWDRDIQMIRDPNPLLPARTFLNMYRVKNWNPIFNQSCAMNKVRKDPLLYEKLKDFLKEGYEL